MFKKKEPSHSEKVSAAYRCYKPDEATMFFPGGIHQADQIICSLAKIYGLHLDLLDGASYHNILTTYTDVFIRKVITPSDDSMIMARLQMKHGDFVKSPEIARQVLAYFRLDMLDHSFTLECEEDRKLLSAEVVAGHDVLPDTQDNIELGFYFENILELAIYGKLFGEGKTVSWLSGDLYLKQYQKGYQLVEQGKFTEAIKALKASLGLNPIGISARFELCECFIQLKDLPSAKQVLEDMSAYLLDPKHIARFYRRMGYIEIENCNYLVAVACYIYSRSFEDHPTIEQELQYIYQEVGVHVNGVLNDPTTILKKYGIPVLKERNIDDIQVPNS